MEPYLVRTNELQKKLNNIHFWKLFSYLNMPAAPLFSNQSIKVMAHSLTPAAATAKTPIWARSVKSKSSNNCSITGFHLPQPQSSVGRRTLTVGLSGTVLLGLSLRDEQSACAARRPPPPPPPEEKKDPNVSGVQAKVLASKKRKQALKETVAKLREKGKLIKEPPE